jgi:hypothetical protein
MKGDGPSAEQSFLISGAGLTSYLIVTPSVDFQISAESGAAFTPTNQILLTPASGNVAETPIYIRLKSGLPVSTYNEIVTIASTGFTTKNISVSGNVLLSTATETASGDNLRVFGRNNEIVIDGTTNGETVTVYNVVGVALKSVQSTGEEFAIPVKSGSVYLVRTAHKIIKVVL